MSNLKAAAIELAERGLWIFPCRTDIKRPKWEGYRELRMTVDEVRAHWTKHPNDNIAMCPDVNGMVVLDLDLYKPECNWDRDDIPETMMVRSARGGEHHYFKDEGNDFPGKFNGYKAVDIKHKGFVVMPPSRFDGDAYEWVDFGDPVELPSWFPTKVAVQVDSKASALMTAMRGENVQSLIELLNASENVLDDREQWRSVGMGMHWESHGTEYADAARDAFIEWSARWAGGRPDELRAEALKLWNSAKSPADLMVSGARPTTGGSIRHLLAQKPELPPISDGGLFRRVPEIREDIPSWLVPDLIRVGGTHAVVGMSAVGKTALSAGFIAGMLAGRTEVYGLGKIDRPLNIAWANAEEAAASMKAQIEAAQHRHMLKQIGDLLIVGEEALESEVNGLEIVLEQQNPNHGRIELVPNEPLIQRLIDELKGAKVDLFIVDPITEFNGGDENLRFHARLLNRQFRRISIETGVAVMYWAHTGKPPESKRPDWYVADLYAQRGSSQNIGSVQGGSTLTPFLPAGKAEEAWDAYNAAKRGERPNLILFNTVKMKMSPTLLRTAYVIEASELNPDVPVVTNLSYEMADLTVKGENSAADQLDLVTKTQALIRALGAGLHGRGLVNRRIGGRDGFPKDLRADRPESKRLLQRWTRSQEATVDGKTYAVKVVFDDDSNTGFEVSIIEVSNA